MKRKKWFIVVAALLIIGLGAMGQKLINNNWQNTFNSEAFDTLNQVVVEPGDINRQVAILEVEGTIMDNGEPSPFDTAVSYNHQATLDSIEDIKSDETIKALLLTVDSPGGTTYHSLELYRAIQDLKAERDIPIYVSMGTQAASGGYMISMPADKIFADNETVTGSIGVIASVFNFSGFMEEHGIAVNAYKSGDNKDMGSAYRPATDEENEIWQDIIDESYTTFVDIVAQGRGMQANQVRALADGRIYSGSQAVENNLIDAIGYESDALNALRSDHELEGGQVINMTPNVTANVLQSFMANLSNLPVFKSEATNEYDMIERVMDNDQMPTTYYMYGGA